MKGRRQETISESLNSPLIEDHQIEDWVGACTQLDKADRGQKVCFSPTNQPPAFCPLPSALPEGLVNKSQFGKISNY